MVNLAKIWHEQIDNEDNRASAIRRLKDLSARGVDLLFVRMPEDESLESLECQVSLLKLLKKEFPPDKYFWIEPGANHPFVTFDGLHLDVESQQAYGKLLNEALRTYLRNNHSKDLSSTLRIKRGAAQRVES